MVPNPPLDSTGCIMSASREIQVVEPGADCDILTPGAFTLLVAVHLEPPKERKESMSVRSFKPSSKYLIKLRVVLTLIAVAILLTGMFISIVISLDKSATLGGAVLAIAIIAGLDIVWWFAAMVLAGLYFRSLGYEIQDDEVIVRVGIWTKSVKHVPYRTVTNLTVQRDIFDRWFFGLGSLKIQTAGMSGTTGAEENLVGLADVQDVYDIVVTELRRFRGGMAPTAAEVDDDVVEPAPGAMAEILDEVRAIRQALEAR
jgi:uncharacterized membrane protein YdbT with pleckstrin-like domain